jgi:DNA segregation ATPase FtsK/SpoIIIE-like protein
MRIKFTQDYTTKANKPRTFKKDEVVDLEDDEAGRASAQHFLSRNVAVDLDEEEAKPARARAAAKEAKADAKAEAAESKSAQAMVPHPPAKG